MRIKRPLPGVPREPTKPYQTNTFVGLDGQLHKRGSHATVITRQGRPQSTESRREAQKANRERARKTRELIEQIAKERRTIDEMCGATGYSISYVESILSRYRQKVRNERKARARELFRSGMSNKEIAIEMGLTQPTVRAYTKCLGAGRGHYKRQTKADHGQIARLYEMGFSYREIAEKSGVSLGYVYGLMSKLRERGLIGRRHNYARRKD